MVEMSDLTWKNIVLNLLYYALTVWLLPSVLLRIESQWGIVWQPLVMLRIVSLLVGLAGVSLQLWCILVFQKVGRGTPSPLLPPKNLVTAGPYSRVRNPMNLGEVLLFLALSGWFGSPALLFYAGTAWAAFHLFVVCWEEPKLLQAFGHGYASYRSAVSRWLPSFWRTRQLTARISPDPRSPTG